MSAIDNFDDSIKLTATATRKTTATPTSSDAVTTVDSFMGILRPVTEVAKLYVENNIGREFDLVIALGSTVRTGDDLTIGSVKYDVLGVADFDDLEGDDDYTNLRVVRK